MAMALEGIRVIDLSRLAPGPYCTMILADLGAEVIRVEGPREGRLSAVRIPDEDERARVHNALDRNKKSIVLNLRNEEARQVFYKLAKTADVIVEGFRPGVVKRLGVDYDTIKELNPRVVYCSLTGYGQDGPYQNMVGHDINYISIGGALGIIGPLGGDPVIPSNLMADYAGGGMHAALGIMVALFVRERTGRGQYVDIAMTDGVVSLMSQALSFYFATQVVPQRGDDRLTGGKPYYNVYETKDGKYISLGSIEPWFWENLCRALGRENFIPYQEDLERRQEIHTCFSEVFRTKNRDQWFELLRQTDICVAPVYTLDELASDPQLKHRQMIVELDHPSLGKVRQTGISLKLSETPGEIRAFPARFGEHTQEMLLGLGYTVEEIQSLRQAGAIV